MENFTNEFSFILKSTKQGVGVFAIYPIKEGTHLRLFGDREGSSADGTRLLKKEEIPKPFQGYCLDRKDGMIVCPSDFGAMAVGWYLNHSVTPNASHKDFIWYASQDIHEGEEITIDYNTLEEPEENHDSYYTG